MTIPDDPSPFASALDPATIEILRTAGITAAEAEESAAGVLVYFGDVQLGRSVCRWRARFEWKLEDLWVGAFWKRTGSRVDLWICVLPCVPLHVSWWHEVS